MGSANRLQNPMSLGADDVLPATLGNQELILQEKEFTLRGSQLDYIKEELSIADSSEKFNANPLAYDYVCQLLVENGAQRHLKYVPLFNKRGHLSV